MDHAINTSEEKIQTSIKLTNASSSRDFGYKYREKREIPLRRLDLMPMISNDLCDNKRKWYPIIFPLGTF